MKYREIPVLDKQTIIDFINSKDENKIIIALWSLFLYEIDKELAIEYAKWAIGSSNLNIVKTGIAGMGKIAQVYGLENINVFKKSIEKIEDSDNLILLWRLDDTRDDIHMYIPANLQKTLNESIQIRDSSLRRIGVDSKTGEIIIFETIDNRTYQGYRISRLKGLTAEGKKILIEAGKINEKGSVI